MERKNEERVAEPADAVIRAIRHQGVGTLPRGELFISNDFLDARFPHLKGDYPGQLVAAARLLDLSAIGVDLNAPSSLSTLSDGGYAGLAAYFGIGCIDGPFARLLAQEGFVNAMISTRKDPGLFSHIADRQLTEMEEHVKTASENGLRAIAVADDIAGKNGLLFSPDYFARIVLPAYRAIARLAISRGLYAFLHSDGDMRSVLHAVVDAGFTCLHPVDAQGGVNLYELKEGFSGKITFMGHLDLMAWDEERLLGEIRHAEDVFGASGGLILGSAGGISLETPHAALAALYPVMKEGEHRQ